MIQEPFAIGNSVNHRTDPRFRVVFAAIFSFAVALSTQIPAMIAALGISILLAGMSRLKFGEVMKRLTVVWGFLLLLWLILPMTAGGDPMYHLGPLTFTRPGVILCLQITLKSNAILLAFISLVATMSFATLGHALERLRVPEKLVYLLLMTYRYIFVIEQEYLRLARAAKLRNFHPGTNLHTYRTYAYIVGMLFVRASERAERVYQAMRCRGFRGKFYSLREFSVSRQDWIWSGFMSLAIAGVLILELFE